MSGIRREHVRVLNVDDETGHTGPRSAAGAEAVAQVVAQVVAEVVTARTVGRSCRVADGASVPRVAHIGSVDIGGVHVGGACIGGARIGRAHRRIARGGVPHADVLGEMRHDAHGPELRTAGPEPRTDGLTSASTIRSGRGAANAGSPTEAGR